MKKLLAAFALLLFVVIAAAVMQRGVNINSFFKGISPSGPKVTIDNHIFSVYIANTLPEKELGLGGRKTLDANMGMLFPFDHADYYGFWMKGMQFPLDIIYIKDGRVVTIYSHLNNPTPSNDTWQIVKPTSPANQVLEINADLAKRYNFKVGDTVTSSL